MKSVKGRALHLGLFLVLLTTVYAMPVFYEEPFHEDDVGAAPWAANSHGGFTNQEYGPMRLVRDLPQSESEHQDSSSAAAGANLPVKREETQADQGRHDSEIIPNSESSNKKDNSQNRDERHATNSKKSKVQHIEMNHKQIIKKSDNPQNKLNDHSNIKNRKELVTNPEKNEVLKREEQNTGSHTKTKKNSERNHDLASPTLTRKAAGPATKDGHSASSGVVDKRESRSVGSESYQWGPSSDTGRSWIMNPQHSEVFPIAGSQFGSSVPDEDVAYEFDDLDEGGAEDNNFWVMQQQQQASMDIPESRLVDETSSNTRIRSRSVSDDTLQLLLDEKASEMRPPILKQNAKDSSAHSGVDTVETLKHSANSRETNTTAVQEDTTTEKTTTVRPKNIKNSQRSIEAAQILPKIEDTSTELTNVNETDPSAPQQPANWKILHLLEEPREDTLDIFIGSGKRKRAKTLTILLPEDEAEQSSGDNTGGFLKRVASKVGASLCKDAHPCLSVDKHNVGRLLGALLMPLVREEPENWRVLVHNDYAVDDAIEDLLDKLSRERSSVVELEEGNAVVQRDRMVPLPVIKGDLIEELPFAQGKKRRQLDQENEQETNQKVSGQKHKRETVSSGKPTNLLDLEDFNDEFVDEPAKIRVKRT